MLISKLILVSRMGFQSNNDLRMMKHNMNGEFRISISVKTYSWVIWDYSVTVEKSGTFWRIWNILNSNEKNCQSLPRKSVGWMLRAPNPVWWTAYWKSPSQQFGTNCCVIYNIWSIWEREIHFWYPFHNLIFVWPSLPLFLVSTDMDVLSNSSSINLKTICASL